MTTANNNPQKDVGIKKLMLYTSRYPGGDAEFFIEPELHLLAKQYHEIHIFPLIAAEPKTQRHLPENCVVHEAIGINSVGFSIFSPRVLRIAFLEWLNATHKRNRLRTLKTNLVQLAQCVQRSKKIAPLLQNENEINHAYCFWMEDWATTLALIKQQQPAQQFICRVHGYDLYYERRPQGFIPWRYFQLKHTAAVVAVSADGKQYMQKKFPKFASKIYLSHLGTTNQGFINAVPVGEMLNIVSCANMIPLKRVDLLYQMLQRLPYAINWVHLGDGSEMENMTNMVATFPASNVKATFMGRVTREQIYTHYANHAVDMFVHLSESEGGVPLVIQEALSVGIPVLACDVGGVREIVCEKTGSLLPVNFTETEFIANFDKVFKAFSRNTEARKAAQMYWEANFDLEKSTQRLVKIMSDLYKK